MEATKVKAFLEEFALIFEQPKNLSPTRRFDHKIPLKFKAQPVNIRPYKSSFVQKGEIEKMVKKMLMNDRIQYIFSPFITLILLVKKKNNFWRFYMDYKQLNILTIRISS